MKHVKGHRHTRRHTNIDFAVRTIENRPKDILTRLEAGHWEGDTLYSGTKGITGVSSYPGGKKDKPGIDSQAAKQNGARSQKGL